MLHAEQVEELICLVSSLGRQDLVEQFRSYQSTFPVDFTADFLETQPVDRLRHIFLAVCLQSKQMPEMAVAPLA
jgi:hypothetical protein